MTSKVQYIEVTGNEDGQRVDNFLFKKLKNVPKSCLYKIIRKGELRVNKKRVKVETKLHIGDMVRIPPIKIEAVDAPRAIPDNWLDKIEKAILLEHDDFLILNKPAGIAVHSGTGDHFGVIEVLRTLFSHQPMLELAHRLDKETSGCLIIAKNRKALLRFHDMFKQARIDKKYRVLVHGHWPKQLKKVEMVLARGAIGAGQRGVKTTEAGKFSRTYFKLIKQYDEISELEASIETGRMHQIRVHTAESGYPVIGDNKYGDWEKDKALLIKKSMRHMYLHAHEINFEWTDQPHSVRAPLPVYFSLLV